MRKTDKIKYICSAVGIVVLIATAICAPRIYNIRKDNSDFGKVHTAIQDEVSYYEDNNQNSVPERIKMLADYILRGTTISEVKYLSESFDEERFIKRINEEVSKASEYMLIPDITRYCENLTQLSCREIKKNEDEAEGFKYWHIEFGSPEDSYYIILLADYKNYTIYYAEVYYEGIERNFTSLNLPDSELNEALSPIWTGCIKYYMPDSMDMVGYGENYEYFQYVMEYGEAAAYFESSVVKFLKTEKKEDIILYIGICGINEIDKTLDN